MALTNDEKLLLRKAIFDNVFGAPGPEVLTSIAAISNEELRTILKPYKIEKENCLSGEINKISNRLTEKQNLLEVIQDIEIQDA